MMLQGFGMLICDGAEVADIEYMIEATARPGGVNRASGTIYGRRVELERSLYAKAVQLRRQDDGFLMTMGVTSIALGGLSALVTVIGPSGPAAMPEVSAPIKSQSRKVAPPSAKRRMTFGKRF